MNHSSGRLIVGMAGTANVTCGVHLLEAPRPLPVETHLMMSRSAAVTLAHETRLKMATVRALAGPARSGPWT